MWIAVLLGIVFALMALAGILADRARRPRYEWPECFGSEPDGLDQWLNDCDGCTYRGECLK